jgi:rhamnosyltransferase
MYTNKVSIIIRTKNSSNIIDQTLKALFSQTFKNFDLIIVDSDSTDDTLEKCSKYEHKLLVFTSQEYHPGKVLNSAINKCNTELVVFLNSDCVMLLPNSLQILLDELDDNNVSAAFSRQVCRPEALSWVRRDYEAAFPDSLNPSWMHFSLPLAAIRKEVWEKIPFYTQAWASEDTKWAVDIKNHNYLI